MPTICANSSFLSGHLDEVEADEVRQKQIDLRASQLFSEIHTRIDSTLINRERMYAFELIHGKSVISGSNGYEFSSAAEAAQWADDEARDWAETTAEKEVARAEGWL